jgi:hypothetical protein
MNKVWEFDRVSYEEDGGVVSCHIPVSLFSVEFDSKAFIKSLLPLGSLSVSQEPFYPATVENLVKIGVFFPTASKTLALVYLVTS